ncbi:MAG TPA: SDR family oxidoreductase [Dehalococcoidia bacterium]
MKTLVLGGSQFVGYHLVLELVRQGHQVTVFNRGVTPAQFPPEVRRVAGDRNDPASLREALGGLDVEAVFDVSGYVPQQVEPLVELFRGRLRHYVFTSTTAVYLRSDYAPVDETFPLDRRPNAPAYGGNKVKCEDLLMEAFRAHGFPVTVIRPSYVYGPHNTLTDREFSFFARLLRGRKVLVPGTGQTLFQQGHVDDLARAFAAVLGNERAIGQAYVVTGPKAITFNGYVRTIGRIVGVEPEIVHVPPEVMGALERPLYSFVWQVNQVYDIGKARRELGWEPQYDFESGHRQTYQWYQEQGLDRQMEWDFSHEDRVLARLGAA